MSLSVNQLPIGVFDSGVGGLTVLRALRQRLPNEHLLYLGDTARVPYGTKSAQSVIRYAEQAADALYNRGVKAIVIACNTASAVSIEPLQARYPDIPVIGVVQPGAVASCKASRSGHIGIIATESTVNNFAYQNAILSIRPDASVQAQACSLFVALAEEGWHTGELVAQIIRKCLTPLIDNSQSPIDTLVLGCTHFPVFKSEIRKIVGNHIALVDSADTTSQFVAEQLLAKGLLNICNKPPQVRFLVTDGPDRFARVAPYFFDSAFSAANVELVDIQHITS
ncbi:MAG: glutamate racemase [Pontibacterium sp.]